jgi:Protein of unknown function (DUF4232)
MTLLLALFVAAQVSPPCRAAALTGTFAAVPGSPGAGSISYALTLRNTSSHRCFVTGIPALRLLGRGGGPLPTHVRPVQPGALTAVRVDLAPGRSARATARFSPDVPGPGEPVAGRRCEPTAYWLRVGPSGGGTLRAPIRPPTSVCEHGSMTWTVLTAVR